MGNDIPVRGVLCRTELIELGWPEDHELDRLTALRNRPEVREKFLDPRPLDPNANREWLRGGMKRPDEAVLAMRLRPSRTLCGMVGWTGWSAAQRAPEIGRIVVDRDAARAWRTLRPLRHCGIAADAVRALADYLFSIAGACVLRSTYIVGNRHAARLNRQVGARIIGSDRLRRPDGTVVDVVKLELTRNDWQRMRVGEAA